MKLQLKTMVIHKIFGWVCFFINDLIMWISIYYINRNLEFDYVLFGIASVVAIGAYGALKIWRDIGVNDLGTSSVIVEYICVFIISAMMVNIAYNKAGFAGMIIMLIFITIEIAIIFMIPYRYRIYNKIKSILKKKK